ncbi:MAG: SDR family oxidoreductase [SAR202 cluster bacterium]|nr:SDR family oxidoreductase [SAR202 cluster bacterium]
MPSFDGKVAIITGGAGGIGSTVAHSFAREGAAVVITDMDLTRAKQVAADVADKGGRALAVKVDVTSKDDVFASVERGVEHFGRMDYLVHCAGNNIKGPVLDLSLDAWNSSLATHLTGAFLFCQAVGRELVKQGNGGRVVLMSSIAAVTPVPERGAYSPAKAGLIALAKQLSLEWAKHRINVNAVCPGVVLTPMTDMVYKREPQLRAQRLKRTPMGREVNPQEVADLVLFLCSDKSTYITGAAMMIDGGFTHAAFLPEEGL